MVLPELSECQLCIQGYFKTSLEKDLCVEFFEGGNDLLANGLEQKSCVEQELHGYETELLQQVVLRAWEGGQAHCP